MKIEEFLEQHYPKVLEQYNAWEEHGWTLKPGDWVITLQAGFSGHAGRKCQYLGYEDDGWPCHNFGYEGEEPRWAVSPEDLFDKVKPIENPAKEKRNQ